LLLGLRLTARRPFRATLHVAGIAAAITPVITPADLLRL
jgi:hypothetical protein